MTNAIRPSAARSRPRTRQFSTPTPSLSAQTRPPLSNSRRQLSLPPSPSREPPLDRLLQAILRESLAFFIRKAFATVSQQIQANERRRTTPATGSLGLRVSVYCV